MRSINFNPSDDEWVSTLVDLLDEAAYPRAGRAEVVRVALLELQGALSGLTRLEILKFFVQRDAERVIASFDGTPRLPFT